MRCESLAHLISDALGHLAISALLATFGFPPVEETTVPAVVLCDLSHSALVGLAICQKALPQHQN